MDSQESKKLKSLKKVESAKGWDDDLHVRPLIPESLPEDLNDDDLYLVFYRGMEFNTNEEGSRLKISFSCNYYFGDIENKHIAKLTWEGEIDTKGEYVSLNRILSAVVEWLVLDGIDYLYAGRFEDAIATFSLERKLRESNIAFKGFPSNACIWLSLGMIYLLKNPEQSFKCIGKARESFRSSKHSLPAFASDIERILALFNDPKDIRLDKVLDKVAETLIKISLLSEDQKQNRQILREIDETMQKTLPEVESRIKKEILKIAEEGEEKPQTVKEAFKLMANEFTYPFGLNSITGFFINYGRLLLILWKNKNYVWFLFWLVFSLIVLFGIGFPAYIMAKKAYLLIKPWFFR